MVRSLFDAYFHRSVGQSLAATALSLFHTSASLTPNGSSNSNQSKVLLRLEDWQYH